MKTLLTALAGVLCFGSVAAAQGPADQRAEMEKRMKEITRLMRESEQLLHEMTKVDRVVQRQREIIEELKKLQEPPPNADARARQAAQQQREKLEKKQKETEERIRKLFEGQKSASDMSVQELVKLLKSLPRNSSQGQGKPQPKNQKQRDREREREQQLRNREKQKQLSPREKREQEKKRRAEEERRKKETEATRLARMEAWITRLPPEVQDRINRNDFSAIPLRYRRLVQQYTEARAKREAEAGRGDR